MRRNFIGVALAGGLLHAAATARSLHVARAVSFEHDGLSLLQNSAKQLPRGAVVPAAAIAPEMAAPAPEVPPAAAQEAAPAVPEASPVLPEAGSAVPEAAPVLPDLAPTPQEAPMIPEAAPTLPQAAPTIPEAAPAVPEAAAPALPEAAAPVFSEAAPAMSDAAPAVSEVVPTLPGAVPALSEAAAVAPALPEAVGALPEVAPPVLAGAAPALPEGAPALPETAPPALPEAAPPAAPPALPEAAAPALPEAAAPALPEAAAPAVSDAALAPAAVAPVSAEVAPALPREADAALSERHDKAEIKAHSHHNASIAQGLQQTVATIVAAITAEKEDVPMKNKVTLMILELIPPLGMLGIDRIYLEAYATGLIKMAVCICTCLIGGTVWYLIDGVAVMLNAFKRSSSINTLGMHAHFNMDQMDTAQTLGWILLAVWVLMLIFGCLFFKNRKPSKDEGTIPFGAHAREGFYGAPQGRRPVPWTSVGGPEHMHPQFRSGPPTGYR